MLKNRLICFFSAWLTALLTFASAAPWLSCGAAGVTGGGGLTSDSPIELPVTIAKNQDGADATSFVFTDTYSSVQLRKNLFAAPNVGPDEAVGVLTGRIKSNSGSVGFIFEGEVADTVTTTDGTFTYAFLGSLIGTPVSVVVFEDGSEDSASPPVNVTVDFDEFAQKFTSTVHLTDYRIGSEIEDADFDIQNATVGVSAQDRIAFIGRDASDAILVSTIDMTGGANTILNEELTGLWGFLDFDADESVYGADPVTGVIYRLTNAGTLSSLGDTSGVPGTRRIRVHPSGDYLAANAFTSLAGEQTQTAAFINLSDETQTLLPLPQTENKIVTDMSFDWTTNAHFAVFKTFDDGTYEAAEYDVSDILSGLSNTLPAATYSFTSSSFIGDPVSDHGTSGNLVYRCESGGNVNLCGYNRTSGSLGVLAEGSYDVTGADFTAEGSSALFAFEAAAEGGGTDEEVALYDFAADTVAFLGKGKNPRAVPSDCRLAAYVSADAYDDLQIGLFNAEETVAECAAQTLAISPASPTLAASGSRTFTASGGVPPYVFSIVAGSGTIQSSIGSYTAPATVGSQTVRVTDREGSVADATVTVLSSNANLSGLVLSKGALTPAFSASTTAYASSLSFLTPSVTVTPTAADASAGITVNGVAVASGAASGAIGLAQGSNAITTQVTAAFGNSQSYAIDMTRSAFAQQAYAKSNTGGSIFHGFSVAIDGDTMAVGAYSQDIGFGATGAVSVYTRSGGVWTYRTTFTSANIDVGDEFGKSVAISGDTIVVGAPKESGAATGVNGAPDNTLVDAGAAYVFTGSGATWLQQAYLKASNTKSNNVFGTSVSISGDTIVVGANGEGSNATTVNGDQADNSITNAGAAYVFTRSAGTWTQQAYLKSSNNADFGGAGDNFGVSVGVSGDTIVVGANGEDSAATGIDGDGADNAAVQSGAAYVFARSGVTWTQQAYVKASNTETIDDFGFSVAVSGDTVAIGTNSEDSNATGVGGNQADNSAGGSGAVYVFTRSGGIWSQQAYVKASNAGGGDAFGWSVALDGNTLVVGARGEGSNATGVNGNAADNSALETGAAYAFLRSGSTWSQELYLKASNSQTADEFGRSVAVSGDTIVAGAPFEASNATGIGGDQADNSTANAGAAYVFQ